MQSEWMKVMLEEIARKRDAAAAAIEEEKRRSTERNAARGAGNQPAPRRTPRPRS